MPPEMASSATAQVRNFNGDLNYNRNTTSN
jgi:hypothetical protein